MARDTQAPPRQRVTWPAGDPNREREKWGRDAAAYCRLKRRPTAGALAKVLVGYLHATDGYAFPSDQTLMVDMGAKYPSAAERAVAIAADELGIIERETVAVVGANGRVSGRRRRIYAARPEGMAEILQEHRTMRGRPNRESAEKTHSTSEPSATFRDRKDGGEEHEPLMPSHRSPNRTPSHSGKIKDSEEEISDGYSSDSVVEGRSRRSVPSRPDPIIEAFAYIGPNDRSTADEAAALIDAGRRAWTAIRRGLPATQTTRIIAAARDAARRAWLDHRTDVKAMLRHLDKIQAERTTHA